MDCQNQQNAFNEAMEKIQVQLKEELAEISKQTEQKTEELNDEFKNENDLAQGVGAVAGTVVGGVLGGPVGGLAGGQIGKQIGSFFTIEIGSQEHKISFDLPEIAVKNQDWIFNIPSVTMKNSDIIFDLPTLVMKTIDGPPIWKTKVEMKTVCHNIPFGKVCFDQPQVTGWWDKTYIDVPTWENRETRIVLGVPEITNNEQRIVIGVPEVTMKTKEIIFNLPTIKIMFIKDAGKELAGKLEKIALAAQEDAAEKEGNMKERMKLELTEPANAMFDCYRIQIVEERTKFADNYDLEIKKLTDALFNLKANNVPETDNDYVNQKAQLDAQIANRNLALIKFDEAIQKFDNERQDAINKMIGL
ncbi:hypothetical protein [Sphingobacterium faecium]|uniref:hypothetical protein n=1 Tax=Sphingobacterium faecium TaxID=34087 RepID=UPI003208EFA5